MGTGNGQSSMKLTGKEVEDTLYKMREKHCFNVIGMWVLGLYGLEAQGLSSNRCQENVTGVGIGIGIYIHIHIHILLSVLQIYYHLHSFHLPSHE